MLQQTLAVFLVLGLLLAALWLLRRQGLATYNPLPALKRLGARPAGRHLQVIERLTLTPTHSLHLISIEDRLFLFATSPSGCQPVDLALQVAKPVDDPMKSGAAC